MKLTKKSLSIPYKMTFSPSFYYVYSLKNLSTHLTKEYEHSIQETHRENFWLNQSHSLSWFKAPSHILTIERQVSGPQGIKGDKVLTFADGLINMCYNCLDRHLMPHNQTAAIIYAKSPSDFITINYYELFNKVNNLASHLKNIQKLNVGDTVMIYMPHAPEAIFAMLACARLGIIYNIIPSTIDAEALGDKIQQFNPKLVITTQETRSSINFLSNLNKAFSAISFINIKTLILKSDHESQLKSSNEKFKGPLEILELSNNKLSSIECVSLPASHPISLNETSGTEGLPRGVYRDTAGLAVYLNWLMKNTFEFDARNVFFCSPGFSWTYGQNYGVYGPLLLGGTTFLYDGDWTDPEIYWKLLSNYKINGFLTFPSLLAHIKQMDIKGKIIQSYDYSALKTMTLTGERCDSSMFNWLKNNINGTTKVIDAYMQQETGFPIFHSQGENPTLGLGFDVTLAQFSDKDLKTGTHMGQILLSLPLPPGCVGNCSEKVFNQEIAVNNKGKYYRTGDLGYINEDGKVEVCREEDIITVGEYEFSSRVIEEQLNYHRFVKEIAVVAGLEIKEDNLKNIVQKKRVYVKGRGLLMKKETILENENLPVAFIVLKPNVQIPSDELSNEMIHLIKNEVSPLLSLRKIIVVKELPRNINGMVLKRLLNDMCLKKRYQLPKNIVNRECIKDIEESLK